MPQISSLRQRILTERKAKMAGVSTTATQEIVPHKSDTPVPTYTFISAPLSKYTPYPIHHSAYFGITYDMLLSFKEYDSDSFAKLQLFLRKNAKELVYVFFTLNDNFESMHYIVVDSKTRSTFIREGRIERTKSALGKFLYARYIAYSQGSIADFIRLYTPEKHPVYMYAMQIKDTCVLAAMAQDDVWVTQSDTDGIMGILTVLSTLQKIVYAGGAINYQEIEGVTDIQAIHMAASTKEVTQDFSEICNAYDIAYWRNVSNVSTEQAIPIAAMHVRSVAAIYKEVQETFKEFNVLEISL